MHIPIIGDAECCMCNLGVLETQQHLFGDCCWVKNIRDALASWVDIRLPDMAIPEILQWIKRRHWKQFRKEVAAPIIGAVVYHTWQARNWRILRQINLNMEFCVGQIKKELAERLSIYVEFRKARQCLLLIQHCVVNL